LQLNDRKEVSMQANGMIFWDWNGTLMDDVDFTHSCLNWMLETHGYPQRYDLNQERCSR